MRELVSGLLETSRAALKTMGIVIERTTMPEETKMVSSFVQICSSLGLPVYYSFAAAADAISLVLEYNEKYIKIYNDK